MSLPEGVRRGVEAVLERRTGRPDRLSAVEPVSGGCVSPVARVRTELGGAWFLKWVAAGHPEGLLEAEARGLRTLARTGTVRVPEVAAAAPGGEWLLLEWIEPGPALPDSWARLGTDLAGLHRRRAKDFGAPADNFIGPLPQPNAPVGSWPTFWATRRLEPQLRRAADAGLVGRGEASRVERLMEGLEARIGVGDDEGPSTLHGDLWSGNVHTAADGRPAVIDPSCYHGHREVDLAMAELFGGFGADFRSAYEEAWPLEPGYAPVRRAVYQLYYLLVHVNLFGAGYLDGCRRALQEAGV